MNKVLGLLFEIELWFW